MQFSFKPVIASETNSDFLYRGLRMEIVLVFRDGALEEVQFSHPQLPRPRRSIRGRVTTSSFDGSFLWTGAVQALTLLLVEEALARGLPQSAHMPSLVGGTGTAAATLDYALDREPLWMKEVFGVDKENTSLVKTLISRVNPRRKREGEVQISFRTNVRKGLTLRCVRHSDRASLTFEELSDIRSILLDKFALLKSQISSEAIREPSLPPAGQIIEIRDISFFDDCYRSSSVLTYLSQQIAIFLANHPGAEVLYQKALSGAGDPLPSRAHFCLSGTASHKEQNLLVRLQLVETSSGAVLWSRRCLVNLSTVQLLTQEIVEQICAVLRLSQSSQQDTTAPPSSPEVLARYLQVSAALEAGQRSQVLSAIDDLEAILTLDPSFGEARALLGQALLKSYGCGWRADQKVLFEAHGHLDRCLRDRRALEVALEPLVRLGVHLDKSTDVLLHLARLEKRRNEPVPISLGRLFGVLHSGHTRDAGLLAWELLERGVPAKTQAKILWAFFYDKDFSTVVTLGEQLMADVLADPDLPWCVALSLHALNRTHDAIEILKLALESESLGFRNALYLGHLYDDRGYRKEARRAWEMGVHGATQSLKGFETNVHVRAWRARLHSRLGDRAATLNDLSFIERSHGDNGYLSFLSAIPHMYLGNEHEAVRYLSRAVKLGFRFVGPTWEIRREGLLSNVCDMFESLAQTAGAPHPNTLTR